VRNYIEVMACLLAYINGLFFLGRTCVRVGVCVCVCVCVRETNGGLYESLYCYM